MFFHFQKNDEINDGGTCTLTEENSNTHVVKMSEKVY